MYLAYDDTGAAALLMRMRKRYLMNLLLSNIFVPCELVRRGLKRCLLCEVRTLLKLNHTLYWKEASEGDIVDEGVFPCGWVG